MTALAALHQESVCHRQVINEKLERAGFIGPRREARFIDTSNLEDFAAAVAAMPPVSRIRQWNPPAAEPARARVPRP